MKITAFLQNQWAHDPARHEAEWKKHRERNPDQFIRTYAMWTGYCLLNGCLTGKRLVKAFGQDRFDQINWQNCTLRIGGVSQSKFPPDFEWIRNVLAHDNPDIVLTFGAVAREALPKCFTGPILAFPHPAARALLPSDFAAWGNQLQEQLDKLK